MILTCGNLSMIVIPPFSMFALVALLHRAQTEPLLHALSDRVAASAPASFAN
jgi:hypothetical protein